MIRLVLFDLDGVIRHFDPENAAMIEHHYGLSRGTIERAAHGIADRFDAIFNSAEIGYTKPDIRAFRHVLEVLDVEPAEVFFTDDSPSKLAGAESLSMRTHLFTGADDLRDRLIVEGVEDLIEDRRP